MRIGSDINSLGIVNRLNQTSRAVSRALERLSTGKRVNSARDDSASFSASTVLDSQARGLRQGILNLNQSQAALEVADSAIGSQLDLVQRMREIAVEASNGSITDSQRNDLNKELQQLLDEFRRLTNSTEFNGKSLLDGSYGVAQIHLGLTSESTIDLTMESTEDTEIFTEDRATGEFTDTGYLNLNSHYTQFADMNGDGFDDLVYSGFGGGGIGIEISNGDGTFQAVRTSGSSSTNLVVEDMNGDNILDVVANSGGSLSVLHGNGDGTLSAAKTYTMAVSDFVTGDFDGDNKKDIMAIVGSTLQLIVGQGDGTFSASFTRALAGTGNTLSTADINQDGNLDLAVGTNSRTLSTFLGQGNGTFIQGTSLTTVTYNQSIVDVVLTDFNNDGFQDVVTVSDWLNGTASGNLSYALGNGDGSFQAPTSFNVSFTEALDEVTDLNGDDLPDIVLTWGYLLNEGNGTFATAQCDVTTFGTIPTPSRTGDVNGDGIKDIVFTDTDGLGTRIYLGRSETAAAVSKLTVQTQVKAQRALGVLDTALDNLVSKRSELAALHSRLDFATSSNLILSENIEEARSKMIDADIATETAELVRQQVLQQAQIAVAAQANLQMQSVIQLLSNLS